MVGSAALFFDLAFWRPESTLRNSAAVVQELANASRVRLAVGQAQLDRVQRVDLLLVFGWIAPARLEQGV